MNQSKGLVSIVTIVLNGERYIEETINSVLKQIYSPIEYIVIDGGSTDGTLRKIEKVRNRIDRFISEPDRGIYHAINKGIALARGDLIGLIHCGDYYEPDAVLVAVEHFLLTGADVIYGDLRIIEESEEGKIVRVARSNHRKLKKHMSIFHPATFVSQKCYPQYGLYDNRYRTASDYDWFLRLFLSNIQFYHVDQVLANFRSGGVSGSHFRMSSLENFDIRKRQIGYFDAVQYIITSYYRYIYYKTRAFVAGNLIGKHNYHKLRRYKYKNCLPK